MEAPPGSVVPRMTTTVMAHPPPLAAGLNRSELPAESAGSAAEGSNASLLFQEALPGSLQLGVSAAG